MPFAATWMGLEIIILSEVSQKQKDKYPMTSLTCGIFKKMTQMNLFTRQKQTQGLQEQTYGYQSGNVVERDKLGV